MSVAALSSTAQTWHVKGVNILKKILVSLVAASFLMTGSAMAQAPAAATPTEMSTKAPKKVKAHKSKAPKTAPKTAPVATATP
jgi:Ni/Co efflux regulator RcnB